MVRSRARQNERLARLILLTLAYCDQFSYPLSLAELQQRLLGARAARARLSHTLDVLEQQGLVSSAVSDGERFFALGMSECGQMLQARLQAESRANTKWAEVRSVCRFLSLLPHVEAVAITGSVALNQALEQADIDFLIVTRPNSLWLVRPLTLIFAWIMGKRRSWSHEEGNSWCFNLWLEDTQLKLDAKRRTVYSAYELLQAQWVLDQGFCARRMYLENSWARRVLPEFYSQRLFLTSRSRNIAVADSAAGRSRVGGLLGALVDIALPLMSTPLALANVLLYALQRLYMYGHMTKEEVRYSKAFFHPRNTRQVLGQGWRDSLRLLSVGARVRQRRPILVTGVFDLLHSEHRRFLEAARNLADREHTILVVGLESDVRVRQMKGEGRPIHSQVQRAQNVLRLGLADEVFVLPEQFDTPDQRMKLLTALRPRVLAVSSHSPHQDAKQKMMVSIGGRLEVVHQHNPAISTTLLVSSGEYDKVEADTTERT